jgi:hypothetical protein
MAGNVPVSAARLLRSPSENSRDAGALPASVPRLPGSREIPAGNAAGPYGHQPTY